VADRAEFLGRIRQALRSPVRGTRRDRALPVMQPPSDPRPWLPRVSDDRSGWIEAFAAASVALRTDFRVVGSTDSAVEVLRGTAATEGWNRVATHPDPLVRRVVDRLDLPTLDVADGYSVGALEACPVAITGCDVLVAQTGSVVVTTRSTGGRALSVYPPHHVVVAPVERLVPDLPAAFQRLAAAFGPGYPSLISFITGPSRTGDIERVIVLGAHGPKRLTVLLIADPPG